MDDYQVVCPQCGEVQDDSAECCLSCGASLLGDDTGATRANNAAYIHEAKPIEQKTPWYNRIPWWVIVAVAAAYGISPIDIIPDIIPVAGLVDDGGIFAVAALMLYNQYRNNRV